VIEIDGGEYGRSIEDGVYRVNAVVEGGDGEIGCGWEFDPQNRKSSAEDSISMGGKNGVRGGWVDTM
jgi:hypothetical protein